MSSSSRWNSGSTRTAPDLDLIRFSKVFTALSSSGPATLCLRPPQQRLRVLAGATVASGTRSGRARRRSRLFTPHRAWSSLSSTASAARVSPHSAPHVLSSLRSGISDALRGSKKQRRELDIDEQRRELDRSAKRHGCAKAAVACRQSTAVLQAPRAVQLTANRKGKHEEGGPILMGPPAKNL